MGAASELALAPAQALEGEDRHLQELLGFLDGLERAGSGPRVLIADDDDQVRVALSDLLPELGFIVVGVAPDGETAVRMAEASYPDVILMDVRMPRIDGIEATRRIREIPFGAAVVMLSGYDDAALRQEAEDAGACAYILKDCDPDVLYDTIWRAALLGFSTPTDIGESSEPPVPSLPHGRLW